MLSCSEEHTESSVVTASSSDANSNASRSTSQGVLVRVGCEQGCGERVEVGHRMLERSRVTQEFRCHVLLRQRSPSGSATPTGGFVPQSDETTLVESFQAEPTDLRGIYGAFDVDNPLPFDLMTCH